jgi:hypothetical protein
LTTNRDLAGIRRLIALTFTNVLGREGVKTLMSIKLTVAAAALFLLCGNLVVEAQRRGARARPPQAPAPRNEPRGPALNTSGMQKPEFFQYVHDGRFTRLDNDSRFRMAFEAYVTSFSNRCQSSLSADKVEITKFVNDYRTQTTYIPWGRVLVPLTSERYEGTREVGTGVYAEPEFGEMYVKLGNEQSRSMAGSFRLTDLQAAARDMMAMAEAIVEQQVRTYADVNALLANNHCDGPPTRRFAENLLRFAKGQPPVQSVSGEKSYLAKACEGKLRRLFPKSPPDACGCIDREFAAALPGWQIVKLEDEFDAQDFGLFLMYSVSKIGLQQKIAVCVGTRPALK